MSETEWQRISFASNTAATSKPSIPLHLDPQFLSNLRVLGEASRFLLKRAAMPFPPTPPPPPHRGRGDDLDEPSAARSSLRRLRLNSPGRRTAAHHQKPKLNLSYYNACRLPTSSQELSANVVHQDESCLESEFELDSPPRIIMKKMPVDQEPITPTSPPPGTPPSIDVEPEGLSTFGSDIEEWYSSDGEDDLYFKSLVDNFVATVCSSSEDKIDEKTDYRRPTDEYAESALKYYNNDKKVKYDLIRATVSCGMVDVERCYAHVNFIAKGNQEHSKEELFFAEIQLDTLLTPTSVLSLEGVKKVGGLRESKYDRYFDGEGLPIDDQHCYACQSKVLHPKNGALYESGHVAFSGFYHLMGN